MKSVIRALAAALALAGCADPAPTSEKAAPVIFAAASLTGVLQDVGDLYAAEGHPKPHFSFAASSALAKQLEQGAQADIFISADEAWMDYAAEKSLIDPATRTTLLSNELVLVAPAGAPITLEIAGGMDLAAPYVAPFFDTMRATLGGLAGTLGVGPGGDPELAFDPLELLRRLLSRER